jgi:hypothetical protein
MNYSIRICLQFGISLFLISWFDFRAQSVRRTSLRDKNLTTKKDAAEETRLRLQAQEVSIIFIIDCK